MATKVAGNSVFSAMFLNMAFLIAAFYLHGHIYEFFVFPFWEYRHFRLEFDPSRIWEALVSVIAFSTLMPRNFTKASDLYILLLAVFFVSSNAALYVHAGLAQEVFLSTFTASVAIAVLRNIGFFHIPRPNFPVGATLSALLLFCTIAAARVILLQGFEVVSFDFLDVEERRFAARETITGLDAYLTTYGQQLSVLGFVASLYFGKRMLSAIFAVSVGIFFLFVGQKSFIFIAIVSFTVVYYFGNRYRLLFFSIIAGMSVFLFLNVESLFGFYSSSLIFRRISYAPALLNEAYISYFTENGFIYWGYSKIGLGLVPYADELSPAFRIGEVLFPGTQAHANTGIIGSGYMNAGYAGIALYAIMLGLACAFLDRLGKQSGNTMLISALCAPQLFLATTTSDLPGMVLSAGLGTAIFVSWLMSDSAYSSAKRPAHIQQNPNTGSDHSVAGRLREVTPSS